MELEKISQVSSVSYEIGEFVEWLKQRGIVFAEYDRAEKLREIYKSTEFWLAEYYGIDLAQAERERKQILERLQAA
mgnify:CR=1 FL=1